MSELLDAPTEGTRLNGFTLLRRCLAVAVSSAVAAAVAGCGASGNTPAAAQPNGALAVVVGAHGNAPKPVLTGAAANARDLALNQRSHLSLVVADGAPFEQDLSGVLEEDASAGPGEQRSGAQQRINDAVAGARAKTPESDLLTAIGLAANSVREQQGLRTVVVLDSGLSTAGALDFRQRGLLDADPQDVTTTLADSRLLPDLTGVAIVFAGLGETAAPQETLDRARRTQLESIWTGVAKRAGAITVQVEHPPLSGTPAATLPGVTPVTLDGGYQCRPDRVVLTGGRLGFKPGSGELLDPAGALQVLRPIVEQVLANDIPTVLLGTDADVGDPGRRRQVSEDRAQSVADMFISLGVPISQLKVEGLGSDFEGFIGDHDSYDRVIPAAAAMNRKVIINFAHDVRCP